MSDETRESIEGPPNEESERRRGAFPIVGIGASAGGLHALEEFFAALDPAPDAAFVVVTHMDPRSVSYLAELLGRVTPLSVEQIRTGTAPQRDHVYVGPPGSNVSIEGGVLHLVPPRPEAGLPIDQFFASLAADQGASAVGIILSGTGTDGTRGIEAIKAKSGLVLVQQPAASEYAGMPTSASQTGLADDVLAAADLATALVRRLRGLPPEGDDDDASSSASNEAVLHEIFGLVRYRTGSDFSNYKLATIRRRIERRMAFLRIPTHEQYLRRLEQEVDEVDRLFREFLIGVTSFFRDEEAFEALRQALTHAVVQRPETAVFRAWVPGCATGEEALSIAILLDEIRSSIRPGLKVQLFATDLDDEAIRTARAATYPDGAIATLGAERLRRYFTQVDGGYRIDKAVRETVIYAPHSLISDPPFTRIDLISCRNLLIYMDSALQKRLIPLFHYSLNPGGLLFLGASETIGGFGDLFNTVSARSKIFARTDGVTAHSSSGADSASRLADSSRGPRRLSELRPLVQDRTDRFAKQLAQQFAPPTVIVNEQGDIAYIHGRTGDFLEAPSGPPSNNIVSMTRESIRPDLVAALREVASRHTTVERRGIQLRETGGAVDLIARDFTGSDVPAGLFSISFVPAVAPPATPRRAKRGTEAVEGKREQELARELALAQETLRTASTDFDTTREELRAANEELQSANEEMQSTNEELETSKEEMQSLNEELQTVNAELRGKVAELSEVNDDMANLLNAIEVGTIFVDNELRVKRFTREAQKVVRLIASDVGRALSDIVSSLRYDGIENDAREVLRTLVYKEREVEAHDGTVYLMRIVPYRTALNVIDGLVMTFVDVSDLKRARATNDELGQMWRSLAESVSDLIITIGLDGKVERVYRGGQELRDEPWIGRSLLDLINASDRGVAKECWARVAATAQSASYEARLVTLAGADRWLINRVSPLMLDGSVIALTIIVTDPEAVTKADFSRRREEQG